MKTATTQRKGARSIEKKLARTGALFVLPFLVIYFLFQAYPIGYSFYLSFYQWDGIGAKTFVGFGNYFKLFTLDPYFFKSIGNTLIIMAGYLPITLLLGMLLAILIFNKRIRRKRFFQTAHFLPYVVVPVATGLLFLLLFDWGTGIVNKLLQAIGLIDEGVNWLGDPTTGRIVLILMQIWKMLGYVITIYLAGLTNISSELFEAAEIDGAKSAQMVTKIIVPLLGNVSLFLIITGLIDALQLFDAPKVLFTIGQVGASIGGPERCCLTPVWYMYDTAFGSVLTANMGLGSAIAYGLFLFIAVFSIASYKIFGGKGGDE